MPGEGSSQDADLSSASESGPEAGDIHGASDTREAVTEIPAITYATGPRLRRVRSLPAPPVDDDDEDEDEDEE